MDIIEVLARLERIEKKINESFSNWLNLTEAAEYLRISESTLRKWIKSDSIPFKRLGNGVKSRILFSRKMLDLWIVNNGKTHFTKRDRQELENYI